MDAEQQDQQRRHQRSTADAGHPDQQADAESRGNIKRINHFWAHAIENPERITHDGYDTDLRSLRDSRSRFRNAANAVDDIFQPSSDGISYRGACTGRVIGRIPSRSASARLE